jgi:predicted HTH domain antitoxin
MALTIQLPAGVEQRLRAQIPDLDSAAKETVALDLFQRGNLSHYELSEVLGLDRFETDAYLKRRGITEGSLTMDDLEAQKEVLDRVLGAGLARMPLTSG